MIESEDFPAAVVFHEPGRFLPVSDGYEFLAHGAEDVTSDHIAGLADPAGKTSPATSRYSLMRSETLTKPYILTHSSEPGACRIVSGRWRR